jgi:outer membrane protein assembly factor BamB
VVGNSLWFACDDGEWVALNKEDGQPRWRQTGKKIPASSLISDGVHGFIASENGVVEAIDETGQRLWTQALGPLMWAQSETLISSNDRKVTAVEATTGKPLWHEEKSAAGIAGIDQHVALLGAEGGLSLVDLASGAVQWSGRLKNPLPATLTIDRGSIWVGTEDAEVVELSLDDGSQKSRTSLPEKLASPIQDGIAFMSGSSGCVRILDTQKQWCVDHPLRGKPIVDDGVLLVAPRDGRVLGFRVPATK